LDELLTSLALFIKGAPFSTFEGLVLLGFSKNEGAGLDPGVVFIVDTVSPVFISFW
jgi:hypothetical protein